MATLGEIFTFERLKNAHELCRLKKQHKRGTIMFEMELARNLADLVSRLQSRKYKPGKHKQFKLYDPKERTIDALPYKDRVVLMCFTKYVLTPKLENRVIYDNAASRVNKGTHFAVKRLHEFMRKSFRENKGNGAYFLKCDMSKYFASLDHDYLLDKLHRIGFSDDEMWFMELVVRSYGTCGVPLGNHTSQWFAVLYLDDLDRHIKEKLRVKAYTRYMDDFILIHSDKEFLRKCKDEIETVCQKMKVRLNKNKTQIGQLKDGVDYLGFNHKLTATGEITRRVRASAMIRHKRYLKTIAGLYENEEIDDAWLATREQAFLNHLKGTDGVKVVKHHMKAIRRTKKDLAKID